MRHKSTVVSSEIHNQFETKDRVNKDKKTSLWKKEQKEGQSEYRIEKKVGKEVITK